ncbi:MAG TPA: molybdopterin converting factor subunit 1, partial [Candidatus Limnocylindrales bacterium]|nr:molybdopterin converting factor subunit 1 [Candidatus Limnocylindrales bacterium]
MTIRIRLFAMQRELAGTRALAVELAAGATVEAAWAALVARHPVLAPGRPAVRFAVNGEYTGPETLLADGDEVAMIPPVSGGSEAGSDGSGGSEGAGSEVAALRILELRAEPFPVSILDDLARRLASPEDGAVVGFLGITRRSAGTPAPGQEAEAASHAGQAVEALD